MAKRVDVALAIRSDAHAQILREEPSEQDIRIAVETHPEVWIGIGVAHEEPAVRQIAADDEISKLAQLAGDEIRLGGLRAVELQVQPVTARGAQAHAIRCRSLVRVDRVRQGHRVGRAQGDGYDELAQMVSARPGEPGVARPRECLLHQQRVAGTPRAQIVGQQRNVLGTLEVEQQPAVSVCKIDVARDHPPFTPARERVGEAAGCRPKPAQRRVDPPLGQREHDAAALHPRHEGEDGTRSPLKRHDLAAATARDFEQEAGQRRRPRRVEHVSLRANDLDIARGPANDQSSVAHAHDELIERHDTVVRDAGQRIDDNLMGANRRTGGDVCRARPLGRIDDLGLDAVWLKR